MAVSKTIISTLFVTDNTMIVKASIIDAVSMNPVCTDTTSASSSVDIGIYIIVFCYRGVIIINELGINTYKTILRVIRRLWGGERGGGDVSQHRSHIDLTTQSQQFHTGAFQSIDRSISNLANISKTIHQLISLSS